MKASELPLEPPEQPSSQEAQSFNYAAIDSETRMFLQERARDIKERLRNTARTAWEIGQNLVEVRERLNYGYFVSWLRAEFEWSERTGYNYINIFESFGSFANVAKLETAASASALYLLAAPSTPQDARQEALKLVGGGKILSYKEAKTIVTRHKDALKSKGVWSVTVDTSAQTVSTSALSRLIESAPQTKPNLELPGEPEDELDEVKDDEAANDGASDATKYDATAEDPSYEALLEKEVEPEGAPLFVSAQPEQVTRTKTSANSIEKEDTENKSESDLPREVSDELAGGSEVAEVHGSFNTNGHLNSSADGFLLLESVGRNYSEPVDVGNRSNVNPPLAKENNKLSELCKVLNEGNFSKEELGNVVEVLVYHLGAESIGKLAIGFAHQHEIIDLCDVCFAAMGEEAFSRLRLCNLKVSSLKLLDEEVQRAIEKHNAEQKSKD